ncbi:hypothetical protein ACRAWC_22330 [Leifsonia sp. L25]|uniref:hypothetical protein n=1 Tax=Leifsonia TaxID=110932 RepID=UPI003D66D1CB
MIPRPPVQRAAALLLGGALAAGLAGCSADSNARSSLSQSAGSASATARSAGLVLGLNENDRLLPTVMDTGLTDSATNLAQEASTVATMTAIGGIGAQRDSVLADIRAAQDAVASAQKASAAGHDSGKALERQRQELDRLAKKLDATSKRLEGQ